MPALGTVERSTHNSPLLALRKSDGKHRVCIDFRRLNGALVDDAQPILHSDELLAAVGQKQIFTKLDFAKGYWQVPLSAVSKAMTAFSTDKGHYQFCYMPFVIKTAQTFLPN